MQNACRFIASRLLAVVVAAIVAGSGAASATAAEPIQAEIPEPDQRPMLDRPTPIGDLEYRPGRGLRLGDTGFTLGGFTTLTATRDEGDRGRFRLDAVDLFVFIDPTPYLHVFSDFSFTRLLDVDEIGGADRSTADATLERLYADLNLSDRANFRLGTFLTPVGRWNQVPAQPLVWTTSRPLVTDGPFDKHATGGAFFGRLFPDSGSLTYTLYGQFLPAMPADSEGASSDKSAGARLEFSALDGWSAGGSYVSFTRRGRWNHLAGFDGVWRRDPLELSGEFLAGHGDPDDRAVLGFYLQGVVELGHRVYAVGRYEHFDPGGPTPTTDLYDAGVAWRPIPFVILKADYRFAQPPSAGIASGFQSSLSLLF